MKFKKTRLTDPPVDVLRQFWCIYLIDFLKFNDCMQKRNIRSICTCRLRNNDDALYKKNYKANKWTVFLPF